MQTLCSGFKRCHWSSVRTGRRLLGKWGITPARFEYLYVLGYDGLEPDRIVAKKTRPKAMTQVRLREILGVSRATVSDMCFELEDDGLIERSTNKMPRRRPKKQNDLQARAIANKAPVPVPSDRRTRSVQLTARGLWILTRVLKAKVGKKLDAGFCESITDRSASWQEQWRDEEDGRAGRRLRALTFTLQILAAEVGDTAEIWWMREHIEDPVLPRRQLQERREELLGPELAAATERNDCLSILCMAREQWPEITARYEFGFRA